MTHLVQSSTLALQIVPRSISDILVVGPIFECDLYNSSDANIAPPRLGVYVDKVRLNPRDGRRPSVVSKDFVRKPDNLPPFYVRELRAAARGRPLRHVFRTEASIEFCLYDRSFEGTRFFKVKRGWLCFRERVFKKVTRCAWFGKHVVSVVAPDWKIQGYK